jgi:hypothetical protein
MRRVAIAFVFLATACAPTPTTQASPAASPNAVGSGTASASATVVASPSPTVETPAPTPAYVAPDPRLTPTIAVSKEVFPIMTTLRTKLAVIDEAVINAARWGVERYLESIDRFRNGQSPVLPITGPFLAAVSTALKESATPGVRRQFQVESLTVDHHVEKPWGTHAYIDVTVTLVDRAVDGNAPDQRETGKLRLTGAKPFVTDGWDYEHERWFNGFGPLPLDQVRNGVAEAASQYLWFESWLPNTPPVPWQVEGSAYRRAHSQRMLAIDRRQVTAQLFNGVNATIERFETIEGIWSGVATVRLEGNAVTTYAGGNTVITKLDRHVRVFVLGNWVPEVVDEQLPFRDWVSGGDLALGDVDNNWA